MSRYPAADRLDHAVQAETPPDTFSSGLGVKVQQIVSEPAIVRDTVDTPGGVREANWVLARAAIAELGDAWDLADVELEFLCECGRIACQSTVSLGLLEYVDARSAGHDVVASCHEDPLDLVVSRRNGWKVVARGRKDSGSDGDGAVVGDWSCGCGQVYRVAGRGSRIILWPRNSAAGFRQEPVADRCVNGCSIDRFGVLRELARRVAG